MDVPKGIVTGKVWAELDGEETKQLLQGMKKLDTYRPTDEATDSYTPSRIETE